MDQLKEFLSERANSVVAGNLVVLGVVTLAEFEAWLKIFLLGITVVISSVTAYEKIAPHWSRWRAWREARTQSLNKKTKGKQ